MSAYRLDALGFTHEGAGAPTLNAISGLIPKGKTTLLLGASGAGKSTLIEVVARIVPEYRPGEVQGCFCGCEEPWETLSLKQMAREMGLVFQNPESQFCTYTVEDELAFGPENLCLPPDEIEERVQDALSLLHIQPLRRRPLHSLSGGEKQRVAVASVLTAAPPLLVLDEPTSNLDPAGIAEMFALLADLQARRGLSLLIVEHQLEHLWRHAQHLLLLGQGGKLVFSGTPEEGFAFLMEQPALGIHLPPAVRFCQKLAQKPPAPLLSASEVAEFLKSKGSPPAPAPPALPNEAPPVLACRGLRLSLGGREVLRGVDVQLRKGDFLAIVGPNGAGKTTLLHSLLGIYPGYGGVVELAGCPLKKLGKRKWNHAGIAFQNPEWQFVANSVWDEVMYSLKKSRMSPAEKESRAQECLAQFGLLEKRELSPFVLSQGEKRRLSVACILVRRQEVLLLDEPTFGQDQNNQDELMALMEELNRQGVSIVMVSHNMDLVYRYCSRAVLLAEGQVQFDGSPHQLFQNPELCTLGRLQVPFWLRVGQQLPGHPFIRSDDDAIQQYSL